jgi:hypothetical protein
MSMITCDPQYSLLCHSVKRELCQAGGKQTSCCHISVWMSVIWDHESPEPNGLFVVPVYFCLDQTCQRDERGSMLLRSAISTPPLASACVTCGNHNLDIWVLTSARMSLYAAAVGAEGKAGLPLARLRTTTLFSGTGTSESADAPHSPGVASNNPLGVGITMERGRCKCLGY